MRLLMAASMLVLAGCTTEVPLATRIAKANPAVAVAARGETEPVGTPVADAADDPAIWRNPADPAASLIVGTDKKAGLYVYGLDGAKRSFIDVGRVNNVALMADVLVAGTRQIVVVASDRNDVAHAKFATFTLEPSSGTLRPLGVLRAGPGEGYGTCLARLDGVPYAFMVAKDGSIRQYRLDFAAAPTATLVASMKLATQAEGCAVDEERARLYVGEEDRGLWRFDLRSPGKAPVLVAPADGKKLVADVEGVTVAADERGGGVLVVSSQGDNAYAVWSLGDERWLGRFRVRAGKLGSTEETDGIELKTGDFGPNYPGGLFIAQDGVNAPAAQNFKLVAWADVLAALAQQERK